MLKFKAISMKAGAGVMAKGMTVAKAATVQAAAPSTFLLIPKSAYAFTVGLGLGAFSGVILATAAVVIFSFAGEEKEISSEPCHGNL